MKWQQNNDDETTALLFAQTPQAAPRNDDTVQTPTTVTTLLVTSVWIMSLIFAAFAAFHYLKAYLVLNDKDAIGSIWDATDRHLYRHDSNVANALMVVHFVGGVLLMVAGPIQLLPFLRQPASRLPWHRWIGRIYIGAAFVTSTSATLWTIRYKTSRCNVHEDIGNAILGLSVGICAVQTYRQVVAKNKDTLQHRLWAWRLYGCVLGAPLFRLYSAIYGAFILYTSWQGSILLENGLFYMIVVPQLIVVEILWRRRRHQRVQQFQLEDNPKSNGTTPSGPLFPVPCLWAAFILVLVTTTLVSVFLWLPAIFNGTQQMDIIYDSTLVSKDNPTVTAAQSILHDYCRAR